MSNKKLSRIHNFAKFVKEISDQAKDPILHCMRNQEGHSKSTTVKALVTIQQPSTQEAAKVDQKARHKECKYCKSNEHFLSSCGKFRDEILSNRLAFICRGRRCFKCLRTGHMKKVLYATYVRDLPGWASDIVAWSLPELHPKTQDDSTRPNIGAGKKRNVCSFNNLHHSRVGIKQE